ncbi:hypothetical protein [Bacillus wiedmannii]|uniref:hypothetical protein n=1 Tax=Bacillus wiedmannii TaxID=1890302 RepID=UPI001596AB16|nr:hypothetical protein [Bacillus wiedmannii]
MGKDKEKIMIPTEQYDGILWLEKTSPSDLKQKRAFLLHKDDLFLVMMVRKQLSIG